MKRYEIRERSEFAPLQQGGWDKCPVKREALKSKGSIRARRGMCRHTECTWFLFCKYNKTLVRATWKRKAFMIPESLSPSWPGMHTKRQELSGSRGRKLSDHVLSTYRGQGREGVQQGFAS